MPKQAVWCLWACTQGRLQVRREQPGHRYFHGCSKHSWHRAPFSPPPPELEAVAALGGGPCAGGSPSMAGWDLGEEVGADTGLGIWIGR